MFFLPWEAARSILAYGREGSINILVKDETYAQ